MNESPSETGTPETQPKIIDTTPEADIDSETPLVESPEVEVSEGEITTEDTEEEASSEEEPEEKVTPELETISSPPQPQDSSMREIKVGKVVVNISTGQSGEPLERAMTILENLTGQRPCTRRAKQTIRTFGIRKNEPISCMVTLRGSRSEEFLRKGFATIGNRISPRSFDRQGNFAFGIREHIDIPGQRYDPNLGIIGMDVMVTVERRGYRIARKRRARSKVGQSHRVTREEAIEFIKNRFGVEVGLPSE